MELKQIFKNFKIDGEIKSIEPYGFGHINSTFLAIVDENGNQKRYILQKINSNLFKDVDSLMNNISQ